MVGRIVGTGAKTRYLLDGCEVTKATFDKQFPDQPIGDGSGLLGLIRPHPSDALAVHPAQVAEATLNAKIKGVPTEFLPDGRPLMRSRAHQKEYIRAYGFFNKDGGFGD